MTIRQQILRAYVEVFDKHRILYDSELFVLPWEFCDIKIRVVYKKFVFFEKVITEQEIKLAEDRQKLLEFVMEVIAIGVKDRSRVNTSLDRKEKT